MINQKPSVIFWHTIRIIIMWSICYMMRSVLVESNVTLGTPIGIFLGIVIYRVLSELFDQLLSKMFSLKIMNPLDEFFLNNRNFCDSNVGGVFFMEKLKHENFKSWVKNKFYALPWTAPKMIEMFGKHYLIESSKEEFERKFDKSVHKITGVTNRKELEDYLGVVADKPIDFFGDDLPTQWYVIEDYDKDTSVCMCFGHHAFCDGIQFAAMLKLLSDGPKMEMKDLPVIPKWKWIIGYMALPFLVTRAIINYLLMPE